MSITIGNYMGIGVPGEVASRLKTDVDAVATTATAEVAAASASSQAFANNFLVTIQSNVAAAGTNLATATALTGDTVIVGTSTPTTAWGVKLRSLTTGKDRQVVINASASVVAVWAPTATGWISGSAANNAFSIGAGGYAEFISMTTDTYRVGPKLLA